MVDTNANVSLFSVRASKSSRASRTNASGIGLQREWKVIAWNVMTAKLLDICSEEQRQTWPLDNSLLSKMKSHHRQASLNGRLKMLT